MWDSVERAFLAYRRPIDTVTSLKYLEQVLTEADKEFQSVLGNLRKAWKICACLARIMGCEGASPKFSGMFFKAVVQAVLLFGLETWVLTPHMV